MSVGFDGMTLTLKMIEINELLNENEIYSALVTAWRNKALLVHAQHDGVCDCALFRQASARCETVIVNNSANDSQHAMHVQIPTGLALVRHFFSDLKIFVSVRAWECGEMPRETHAQCVRVGSSEVTLELVW